MNTEIRKAKPEDAERIIEINNTVWSYTYNKILPKEIIEKKKAKALTRIESWSESIAKDNNVFVAIVNNQIVGYESYGSAKDVEYEKCGEIFTAYILKEYQGMHIGRRLAIKCMEELINMGFETMVTRCLEGNIYNEFHKAIGGVFSKQEDHDIQGYPAKENMYYHENLAKSLEMNKAKQKDVSKI